MDKKPSVSIILPCRNSGLHLRSSVNSIINNTSYPDWELILVESESSDGTAELCDEYSSKHDNVRVLHTKKEGITKAINKGIKEAGENDIYLTQDDVILPKLHGRDWLTELVNIGMIEDCGLVGTIDSGGVSGPTYINGFIWNGTWSMYIPRRTIEKVGLLDEAFSPGPGDDIDYSFRIASSGLKRYQATFWVDHHRMTENFNDDIQDVIKRNADYFRKKHGIEERIRRKVNSDDVLFNDWGQSSMYPQGKALEYLSVCPEEFNLKDLKGKKVLDFGCGGGRDCLELAKRGAEVYGVDMMPQNIETAKKIFKDNGLEGVFKLVNKKDIIPFDNEFFDIINCNGVLHHIPHDNFVANELKRVLKKDGLIYLMIYTEQLFKIHLNNLINLLKNHPGFSWQKAFGWLTDKNTYSTFYGFLEIIKLFKLYPTSIKEYHNDMFRLYILSKDKEMMKK